MEWNRNETIELTCPECSKTSSFRFGDVMDATAKCPRCGVGFDGRQLVKDVEALVRQYGFS